MISHPSYSERYPCENRRSETKLKPPTFDGNNSLDAFLAQFNVAALGNRWSLQEKGWQLATCLKGTPSEILAQVDVQGPNGFEELQRALQLRYQSTSRVCQQQFATKKQVAGETPQQLADTLQRLARRSYPAAPRELLDTIVAGRFVVALDDDEVRRFVILSRPTTLYEHVSAALEAQALTGLIKKNGPCSPCSGGCCILE